MGGLWEVMLLMWLVMTGGGNGCWDGLWGLKKDFLGVMFVNIPLRGRFRERTASTGNLSEEVEEQPQQN